MIIKILKNGIEIGTMFSFSIYYQEIYSTEIVLFFKNILKHNDFYQIISVNDGEEKIYNCQVVSIGQEFCFGNNFHVQYLKGILLQPKKVEEDHTGQIYNPYNDTWVWL